VKLNAFIEGVHILRQYMDDQNGYHLGADHDVIYFYATDKPVSEAHIARLRELGWFQLDTPETEYRQSESWAAYV
jgi:hypothetical protein